MPKPTRGERVSVGGHTLQLTNLDKVLYPESGTTKRDVLAYYATVATWLLPQLDGRPATRKRWVDGVDGPMFFEKNLPSGTPSWVTRRAIRHSDHSNDYPLVDDVATLTWLGQTAALELHVPQWRFGPHGARRNPDRMVLDLDPGEGVGLPECVFVAQRLRALVEGMGLTLVPVTSGSKGIHLYAALDGNQTSDQVVAVAHELARTLEADHPDLVLSTMGRQDRRGKVFLDWSQNNANKTTIAPYSLRGRARPTVAAPRTWRELASKSLRQLEYPEVLKALARRGDPMALLASAPTPDASSMADDRLARYRSMRDPAKTPEPVPAAAPPTSDGRSFVIQEHHARRLHWDFRLERDGVLVSWALPKGEPDRSRVNHLAVQTEDHPLEYGRFEGTIGAGQYGAGDVTIWDSGVYDLEKWRPGAEVIVTLHGEQRGTRTLALIHTGSGSGKEAAHWLIHRMERDEPVQPMLASSGSGASLDQDEAWAYEVKWDGIRSIVTVREGRTRLVSRNGRELTAGYPELAELAPRLRNAREAVLDGEIVALDRRGRPDFGRLQTRMGLTRPQDVRQARVDTPVRLMLFDVLEIDGRSLVGLSYDARRAALLDLIDADSTVDVPVAFEGELDEALAFAREHRLEGIVAKRRDSPYTPGRRSKAWVKFKEKATQEVVVAGWRPGAGRRAGRVGSLLLGIPSADGLRYVGRVGTGFRERDLDALLPLFRRAARKTSPFIDVPDADARDAHWITPARVAEVDFAEWTPTGRLRQPSWRGWRPDKDPDQVTIEG